MVTVGILISGVEDVECGLGKIFCGGYDIENDGAVAGQGCEEIANDFVTAIDQKGVIPCIYQFFLGDALHVRKIHHHTLLRTPFSRDDIAGECDLDGIAMAMQMFALAVVVWDAMSGIEFEAAGD